MCYWFKAMQGKIWLDLGYIINPLSKQIKLFCDVKRYQQKFMSGKSTILNVFLCF